MMTQTPARLAKQAGLKNLKQVSELTHVSVQTLTNWVKDKPELFQVVLKGCLAELEQNPIARNHS